MTLISKEVEHVELSACAQEEKFVSMFMGEMTKVEKPSIIYEDNQGDIFLAKNRQVGIHTKHIDIDHHFLRDVVKEKDINIHVFYHVSQKMIMSINMFRMNTYLPVLC